MKRLRVSLFAVLGVVAVVLSGALIAVAQDPVKVAPENHKVLLENDQVRVYEFTLKPGEKVAMHSHPAHVVYFLSEGKAKLTASDGKVTDLNVKAGDVRWSDPVTHTIESAGKTEVKALVVELRGAKKAKE